MRSLVLQAPALALLAALAPTPSSLALPLSVGVSSQIQVGWQTSNRVAERLTRLEDQGTAGRNIRPTDGSASFALYGTAFEPALGQESFDYRATLRDTTTITETRSSSFSVLGVQSTSVQTTNPAPLGYEASGNSVFP